MTVDERGMEAAQGGQMKDLRKLTDLKDMAVANLNLQGMETERLIDLAAAKKQKSDFAKAELEVINAEIQNRAIAYQENRHIKFTEWYGSHRAVASVAVAQTFDILNYFKLKELLGAGLVEEKVKIKPAPVKYDVDDAFKRALTAVILDDYERNMTVSEVIDKAGWCADDPKRKAALLKKLKGEYKKDKKAVLTALNLQENEIDIDTELYLIYQIVNWKLITAFFDEEDFEQTAEAIKKCVTVDETAKIGLRVG